MRIAQVCPYDIDRPGGVQNHIVDTSRALEELGHKLVVIAPNTGSPRRQPNGVEIRRIGSARKVAFGETSYEISIALGRERRALRTLMREGDFDVVHYHTVWTPFLAPQAFFFSRSPAVATFHDTTVDTVSGRALGTMFRLISRPLLPCFGAIITPSDGPKANLVTGRPIIVLPPATDLRRFMEPVHPDPRYRDGRVNVLFLGRLEPRKGAMLLLQAFQQLQQEGLGIRLIVAGSGGEEAALRAYAASHAMRDVDFVGAFHASDTPSWYAAADIFCAPSPHGESFGIVVTEAMASGKPVVAAANEGYRTILTGEAARFLTPPGDVAALRDALRVQVRDAGLRARLGEWGRGEALRYDSRTLAPRLVEIYRQAIADRAPKSRSAI